MTDEATNNQQSTDWRADLKREIAPRVAAGESFDDILAMLAALAEKATKTRAGKKTPKSAKVKFRKTFFLCGKMK